ncbi:hypothetical protein ACFC5Z_00610 [Streptomyces sp. NPDC056004]|uniref:hypothetical protein n=1 Tax=unclassified Streptomyces TaxID=2593676 RepID=UPI0035DE38D8
MDELPSTGARTAVQALLVDAAGHPDRWPVPGGEEIAHAFGTWCRISYVAYVDSLEARGLALPLGLVLLLAQSADQAQAT